MPPSRSPAPAGERPPRATSSEPIPSLDGLAVVRLTSAREPCDFGAWLEAAIAATGESVTAFGAAVGLSRQSLRHLVAGTKTPRWSTVDRIAAHVGAEAAAVWALVTKVRPARPGKGTRPNVADRPWSALQARCTAWMQEQQRGLGALAAESGVAEATLFSWYERGKGATLTRANLARLGAFFDLTPEAATAEAGGLTAEDRRAAEGRRTAHRLLQHGTAEMLDAQRRAGRTKRGVPKPPAAIAKRSATRQATGADARAVAALARSSKSVAGRLRTALVSRLQRQPTPTADELREWECEAAGTFGLPIEAVRASWRPRLVKRGLFQAGGRKAAAERYQLSDAIYASWPKHSSGQLRLGVWEAIARAWARAEDPVRSTWTDDQVDAVALRPDDVKRMCLRWRRQHPPEPSVNEP